MPLPETDKVDKFIMELDRELIAANKGKMPRTFSVMTFPSYKAIEEPLLCLILFRGGPSHEIESADTYRPLGDFFNLSEQARREILEDGQIKWNNMIQWARRKLKDNGYLATAPRGTWKLSAKGLMEAQRLQHRYGGLK